MTALSQEIITEMKLLANLAEQSHYTQSLHSFLILRY